jgi:dipeptidyl aminopeptidase/acylaminoacyl peptidase
MKKAIIAIIVALALGVGIFLFRKDKTNIETSIPNPPAIQNPYATNPLSVEYQRNKEYPGSELKIEQTLENGSTYKRYIASYMSEGLKIYGLLSIPDSDPPTGGFPAIIFNHGYIPPEEYRTTERYVAYFDTFAKDGYVVFKPDYRGNGSSEGKPEGAYFSPGYTTDVMNALKSVEKLSQVNKQKMGMWGHSMGGFLTLRALVLTHDIKAAVIWGGVVGSYKDMSDDWWSKRIRTFTPSTRELQSNRPSRQNFTKKYGEPSDSPFWNAISATTFLNDITTPIQLHHGLSDEEVPPILSTKLAAELKKLNKPVELFTYEGNDHNISQSFNLAMQRSVAFFNTYLK